MWLLFNRDKISNTSFRWHSVHTSFLWLSYHISAFVLFFGIFTQKKLLWRFPWHLRGCGLFITGSGPRECSVNPFGFRGTAHDHPVLSSHLLDCTRSIGVAWTILCCCAGRCSIGIYQFAQGNCTGSLLLPHRLRRRTRQIQSTFPSVWFQRHF